MPMTTSALNSEPNPQTKAGADEEVTRTSGVMVDAEALKQALTSDNVAQTVKDLLNSGVSLNKKGDFKIYENEEPMFLKEDPNTASITKEALTVHNDTKVSTQRKIDEWFGAEDFGAVIVDEIVNKKVLDPYDFEKHKKMMVEIGRLKSEATRTEHIYNLAVGQYKYAEFLLKEFEEKYEEDIKNRRQNRLDGAKT